MLYVLGYIGLIRNGDDDMARITIKSRKVGHKTFWMPDTGGYVRLESDGKTGTLGRQICYGGGFRGNTVSSTPDTFEADVRKWWRAYIKSDLAEFESY